MGCCTSKPGEGPGSIGRIRTVKWKSDEPLTPERLKRMREEFWDTQPHYGGDRVIWDALKAAMEADREMKKVILESAGIIVQSNDLSVCYDEKGVKYELPNYVLSDPANIIREKSPRHVELSAQG